jgi:hypothetical protein
MMSVSIKTLPGSKPALDVGVPVPLFESHLVSYGYGAFQYDMTPDAQRFLITTPAKADNGTSAGLTIVTNWNAGLRK